MPNQPLQIVGQYNVQRFKQFSPEDCANWYLAQVDNAKTPAAMYPVMGRQHVNFLGKNILVFDAEPRGIFQSVNYFYVVVSNRIYRYDRFYNRFEISQNLVQTISGRMYFDYLIAGNITFACFTDGVKIYVSREDTISFDVLSGTGVPTKPKFIKTFGNRIVVSQDESSEFSLSKVNLGGSGFNATTSFDPAVAAQESGIVRQFAVLQNTLYIFTDFTTGIWSNQQVSFTSAGGSITTFPWKKNTTYEFDFGIADSESLDCDFGRMAWLAKNKKGLLQAMMSDGGAPQRISSKAIDVLFQRELNSGNLSPFVAGTAVGFLYEYENTIFYRLSAGSFLNIGEVDVDDKGKSIEYNFETKSWARCIEKNGERNRIKYHIFFNNEHLVTVSGDTTVYEMSGQYYTNEITNIDRENSQSEDAYIKEPFRYERVTPIHAEPNDEEFVDDYVQIDFVFGESNISFSTTAFANAQFLIDEDAGEDDEPVYLVDEEKADDGTDVYLIGEEGNTPEIDSTIYNKLYKPHIELYFSDDGGVSFSPADVREFSQMGYYKWRMRWYELGTSRNRCYKLICVSPVPITVLKGNVNRRVISGGAS